MDPGVFFGAAIVTQLAGKAEKGHRHALTDTDGLPEALNAKADKTALANKSDKGHKHEATDVNGLTEAINRSLPWRGILPDGTDMNTIRTPGIYTVATHGRLGPDDDQLADQQGRSVQGVDQRGGVGDDAGGHGLRFHDLAG